MRRYNLIDEKWIPLRMLDGSNCQLGIRETLLRAKEIEVIEDQSPLVVASIYRFLLALLYRALDGPSDIEQAKTIFNEGFHPEKIDTYLTRWRDRFWLFDDKYPFGQIPSFIPETMRAWTTLTAEHNADNAKVLFDHVNVTNPGTISEAKAICGILATQTFAVSSGKSELAHTGTAPSATAMMVLPIGKNLEETLIFSLVAQNREILRVDLPLWEMKEPETINVLKSGIERQAMGISDLYTWRTRSIRLQEVDSGGIEKIAFASGVKYRSQGMEDPMLAYRRDEKLGILPIQFQERGFWRDFDCILPHPTEKMAPQVIEHVTKLIKDPKRRPKSLMILGQSNDKAKIDFWRMERFTWPEAIAEDKNIRKEIRHLLDTAEETHKILWEACTEFARNILSRGGREPTKEDMRNFSRRMPCTPIYWSYLESEFHRILGAFTSDLDVEKITYEWNKVVKNALEKAWKQHQNSISTGSAWEIRAHVKANSVFYFKSKQAKVTKAINEYEQQLTLKEVK